MAGLAGGLAGNDSASAAEGAQAGKNAVENNFFSEKDLPNGMADYGQSAFTLAESMEKNGYTVQDINVALSDFAKGDHPEGQDPARGFLEAWGNMVGIPLDVFWSNEQMTPEKAAEILSGSPPTTTAKALQFTAAKTYLAFVKSNKPLPQWDAGTGQYNFKDTGKVTDVKYPNGEFNGSSLPNNYDTVWSSIKGTQPVYPGSVIPKSFEMSLSNGQKVWVHGNATEHMAESAASKAIAHTPEAVRLASQEELRSFQSAVNTAIKNNMPYGRITVDGWQLEIKPPRMEGELPTIIHARYLGSH